MMEQIEIWEYDQKKYFALIFKFRGYISKAVYVSKNKRVDYVRIFYATDLKLKIIEEDEKMYTPKRILRPLVEKERLKKKGFLCL